MRKWLPIILILTLVTAVAGVAWAAGGQGGAGANAGANAGLNAGANAGGLGTQTAGEKAKGPQGKGEQWQQAWEDLRSRLDEMAANRTETKALREEIRELCAAIRAEIKRIRETNPEMTEEALEELHAMVEGVKEMGFKIGETVGKIQKEAGIAREGRKNMDGEKCRAAYANVLLVQQTRIDRLTEMIEKLEALLDDLKAM